MNKDEMVTGGSLETGGKLKLKGLGMLTFGKSDNKQYWAQIKWESGEISGILDSSKQEVKDWVSNRIRRFHNPPAINFKKKYKIGEKAL